MPVRFALPLDHDAFLTSTIAARGLRALYVHELRADGVRSAAGARLAHPDAYCTLNRIPGRP